MPKALIERMKSGYRGSGLSPEEISRRIYGHLNNMGAMHGNKETPKGATYEAKFVKDHGAGGADSEDAGDAASPFDEEEPAGSPAQKAIKAHRSKARAQKFINKHRSPLPTKF